MATRKRPWSQPCPVHAGVVHGKEAEELRVGLELLLVEHRLTRRGVQDLLDRVDARDSVAHLENESKRLHEAAALWTEWKNEDITDDDDRWVNFTDRVHAWLESPGVPRIEWPIKQKGKRR